jgi:hypothetical protein
MTAINAIVRPSAAYMCTDTAVYDDESRLMNFEDKATVLPRLKMAVATSGRVGTARAIDHQLSEYATFDEVKENFAGWLRSHFDDVTEDDKFRLLMIHWDDEQKRSELFSLQSKRTVSTGPKGDQVIEAFTFRSDSWCLLQPGPTMQELRDFGIIKGSEFKVDDPEKFLIGVIDWQRQSPAPDTEQNAGTFNVGGCAVLTKIDDFGKIGEFIQPTMRASIVGADNILSIDTSGMSKLKRDMLAKKARKGTLRAG